MNNANPYHVVPDWWNVWSVTNAIEVENVDCNTIPCQLSKPYAWSDGHYLSTRVMLFKYFSFITKMLFVSRCHCYHYFKFFFFENFVGLIYHAIKPCNFQRLQLRKRRDVWFFYLSTRADGWRTNHTCCTWLLNFFESKRIPGQNCKYSHNRTVALHFTVSSFGAIPHC